MYIVFPALATKKCFFICSVALYRNKIALFGVLLCIFSKNNLQFQ